VRILHITPYSADAWAYGGIPRIVGTLAGGLARRGHEVTVCATDACDAAHRLADAKPRRSRLLPWTPRRTPGDVQLRVFPNLSNRLAYHFQGFVPVGLGTYLGQNARQFDVAHLHACRNLPGAIGARHLRRAGVPYVLAPNGTAERIERRQFAKWIFDVAMGHSILDGATRVLAVSNAERGQLTRLGVSPSSISSIPHPVDLAEFTPPIPRGLFRQRFGLGTAPLVLFLGKITPRKRLDVLVRAFARLGQADARLVLAGNDMGGAAGARSLARSLGIGSRTVFTGLLKGRDRLEALADAEVLVYPSQDEIFGLVPLEALLCGTPVIVADDCGCGEVVHGVGGGQVVPLGDADALSHAIEVVLTSAPAWRAAASVAAARVRAVYAGDVVAAQLEQMYVEMIE
jgi:glycosyltransferase involved in cell wall biosynthesis